MKTAKNFLLTMLLCYIAYFCTEMITALLIVIISVCFWSDKHGGLSLFVLYGGWIWNIITTGLYYFCVYLIYKYFKDEKLKYNKKALQVSMYVLLFCFPAITTNSFHHFCVCCWGISIFKLLQNMNSVNNLEVLPLLSIVFPVIIVYCIYKFLRKKLMYNGLM